MQQMTPASIPSQFVPVHAPRGGALMGFMFVLAFYAVIGLGVAGYLAA